MDIWLTDYLTKFILFFAVFGIGACSAPPKPDVDLGKQSDFWIVQQHTGDDRAGCRLVSAPQNFVSRHGVDRVRLLVSNEGLIGIIALNPIFDLDSRQQNYLRVDNNKPFQNPSPAVNKKSLIFSEEESGEILSQMRTGKFTRVALALFPSRQFITQRFPLSGFANAFLKYNVCRVLAPTH